MDIAVVCGRLDNNTFVRPYLFLQTLQDASITVYGQTGDEGLHPFFERGRMAFETIDASTRVRYVRQTSNAVQLWRLLHDSIGDADILYFASGWKHTIVPGLAAEFTSRSTRPTVLDVYDHTLWFDRVPLVDPPSLFDYVIASNTPLAQAVGGELLYTPVDTERFDPDRFDRHSIRSELGFSTGEFVAGFIGTPRPHKGVRALVDAVEESGDEVRGLIVGAGREGYAARLRESASEKTVFVDPVPHSEVPRYYAALDTLVLPQELSEHAEYQIPAKLFEAMSMAKPVVATDVGDLPRVVGDTGEIVPTPSTSNVRQAVNRLQAGNAEQKGRRARERVRSEYSKHVVGRKFQQFLNEIVNGTGRRRGGT